jgi:Zn-dependent protease
MINSLLSDPLSFVLWAVALIVAITIHEFAHAWTAVHLGDPTPKLQGRLTLNPLSHLDPLGTLMLLLVRFGWGKPVQFDPYNLQNPRRDAAIISLAGPVSNLALATVLALIVNLIPSPLSLLLIPIIYLNVVLAIFNLIPVHPLDGGKILVGLMPREQAEEIDFFMRKYGIFLLLLLVFPVFGGQSPVFSFLNPIINFILGLLLPNLQYI